ncbi:hypothetical protein LCGC14_3097330, partial [marine sediment metagenome]
MCVSMLTHCTAPAWPEVESAGVQRVEVLANHTKKSPEVRVRAGLEAMKL